MKYRWEIINQIIKNRGYKSYLEIGVKDGVCFNRVECSVKVGMDVKPLIVKAGVYKMSSDAFFESVFGRQIFDIIFIDGDHHEEQVDRDIRNAIKHLSPLGTVVMHDCNPPKEEYANVEREKGQVLWSGTAYRSFLKLRRSNPDLQMLVVNIDWGCGVIQRGSQELIDIPVGFAWADFDKNRAEWLNLISIDEFQRRYA